MTLTLPRAYDAEICDLVEIFMLSLLSKKYSSNKIGLYRDDGLSDFRNTSGQQAEKQKNSNNFRRQRLTNNHKMQSQNSWLNLNDGTYCPFHKTNEETTYIYVESDHSLQFIKKIPRSIEKRLACLSSTKKIFENSKDYYEQCLWQCRYNAKLNYTEENNKINQKSWKRNIVWFNTPYSKSVFVRFFFT